MQKWAFSHQLTLNQIEFEEAELFNDAQPYIYYRKLYNRKIEKLTL